MPSDEAPSDRILRRILALDDSELSRQILLHREPTELTRALFETHDALMKCLDITWRMQDLQLYNEIYELLAKSAAIIDKSK
ncbi:hypothetical protein [Hyphomicrobium facile]|uniref:Uncharacterized protein n=1 Tax=Hyphomicrobium facile TaxID=51670 RepID=A0A1I7MTK3_9HYPH|nr:hypothetical protein [Hyphomicrobium facile]SFV25729.1 hypothetical protein SAMN04488557_0067 [Hyphomicrobium facile]